MPKRAKTEERKELEARVMNRMMETLSNQEIVEYVTSRLSDEELKAWLGLDHLPPAPSPERTLRHEAAAKRLKSDNRRREVERGKA
jgi:hypothetical protein